MDIILHCPENGAEISLLPKKQAEIMSRIPQIDEDFEIWGSNNVIEPNIWNKDFTKPTPIQFMWELRGNLDDITDLFLLLDTNATFENAKVIKISSWQSFCTLNNLTRGLTYFWKMVAFEGDVISGESAIYSFYVLDELPHWVLLEGAVNIRDMGGYRTPTGRVKTGMLYRGSEVNRKFIATPEALEFMQNGMKIKTDLDIRGYCNIEGQTKSPIPGADWKFYPLLAYKDEMCNKENEENLKKIFSLLAKPEAYPIYMHCVAGADRTGMLAMMILALLGVSENDFDTDYEYTSLRIGIYSRKVRPYKETKEYLKSFGTDIYTGVENYLMYCGVTKFEIDSIRNILIKK